MTTTKLKLFKKNINRGQLGTFPFAPWGHGDVDNVPIFLFFVQSIKKGTLSTSPCPQGAKGNVSNYPHLVYIIINSVPFRISLSITFKLISKALAVALSYKYGICFGA